MVRLYKIYLSHSLFFQIGMIFLFNLAFVLKTPVETYHGTSLQPYG